MKNVEHVRRRVGGTVTARVTWGNPATTFEELDELAETFDYLYWQFVADEFYGADSAVRRQAVLVRLIDKFFNRADQLYPLIPVMGMVRRQVTDAEVYEHVEIMP